MNIIAKVYFKNYNPIIFIGELYQVTSKNMPISLKKQSENYTQKIYPQKEYVYLVECDSHEKLLIVFNKFKNAILSDRIRISHSLKYFRKERKVNWT